MSAPTVNLPCAECGAPVSVLRGPDARPDIVRDFVLRVWCRKCRPRISVAGVTFDAEPASGEPFRVEPDR